MSKTVGRWFAVLALALVAVAAASILGGQPAAAAVTISAFGAKGEAAEIVVTWTSGSEINNVGFNILRSDSQNGTFTKINSAIVPGCGGCVGGESYSYKDVGVNPGQTYFYQLQSVDINGGTELTKCVSQCPVSAAAGSPATSPTPTPTNSPVPPTATNTPKAPTATRTPKPTITKTVTPVPSAPTSTVNPTDVVPTDTLVPDPLFPDSPTSTDVPSDGQDSSGLDSSVVSTPGPTKFAFLVRPTSADLTVGADQPETATPLPSPNSKATQSPLSGSTTTAMRVRQTPAPTRNLPANKSKFPEPPGSRSLGLQESQGVMIALMVLVVALFGLGVLSGLIGLFMWYVKRSY